MHRIIMGDGSITLALNALHKRGTKFGRYHDTFSKIPQPKSF